MAKKESGEKVNDEQEPGTQKPGTFVKGDLRINRKGRPKSVDQLRVLARTIGFEVAVDSDGEPIHFNGRPVTVVERIMLDWAYSKDSRKQMLFVQYGWGIPIEEEEEEEESAGFDVSLPPNPNG